jgi:glycosyltransferase involved in cell wall biosynthesis
MRSVVSRISRFASALTSVLPLKRLLDELNRQETGGEFTYSIVVADNEEEKSGEAVVAEARLTSKVAIRYCIEPRRSIALARNKVVENAEGDFIALIDDDEFPSPNWLLKLFETCRENKVDGILGPVKPHFNQTPPSWVEKSRLYDRRVYATGTPVNWREARTGNVLLKRRVFEGDSTPFRPEFRAGEDHDFFRRKMEQGYTFVWSADAKVFEVIPTARWKRMYFVRKSLLQGATAAQQPDCGAASIAKSIVAVPLYTVALPLALLFGQHRFMTILIKLFFHAGKLLILAGINPVPEEYVSE